MCLLFVTFLGVDLCLWNLDQVNSLEKWAWVRWGSPWWCRCWQPLLVCIPEQCFAALQGITSFLHVLHLLQPFKRTWWQITWQFHVTSPYIVVCLWTSPPNRENFALWKFSLSSTGGSFYCQNSEKTEKLIVDGYENCCHRNKHRSRLSRVMSWNWSKMCCCLTNGSLATSWLIQVFKVTARNWLQQCIMSNLFCLKRYTKAIVQSVCWQSHFQHDLCNILPSTA